MRKFKFVAVVLVVSLAICLLPVRSVKALDFTDEPIIYGVEYTGSIDYKGTDTFLLSVPAGGTLTVSGWCEATSSGYPGICLSIINEAGDILMNEEFLVDNLERGKWVANTVNQSLEKGNYLIELYEAGGGAKYAYTFTYSFDSSTNAKVSSPAKGKLKVTAPKGTNVDGFEVRYRVTGDKTWKTVSVATPKNLNKTFKDLKSGKKYEVQTRKYVSDSYGYKYYSAWTSKQKVTVK